MRAKKTLIILVLLFLILITFFTSIRFKTVKNFTKVYTYPVWLLNRNNVVRIAFLEFMNKNSFLPFYLELYIEDKNNKRFLLDKGNIKPQIYNKKFFIKDLSTGKAKLKGIIKYNGEITDTFEIDINIKNKYEKTPISFAPRIIKEVSDDFNKEDKINYYPRFLPYESLNTYEKNYKDIKIQLFSSPLDLAFSEKNEIFLLFTLKDYTPIDLEARLNIKEFYSKRKNLKLKTDSNGLIYFKENIYRSDGYIYLYSELTGDRKIPFEISDLKTAILTDKYIYSPGEPIKITLKTYKKIKKLFFNLMDIIQNW